MTRIDSFYGLRRMYKIDITIKDQKVNKNGTDKT